jgi:hypothetical protein
MERMRASPALCDVVALPSVVQTYELGAPLGILTQGLLLNGVPLRCSAATDARIQLSYQKVIEKTQGETGNVMMVSLAARWLCVQWRATAH